MGSLPGDSNGNRISNADDIFKLIDNLLGAFSPSYTKDSCDTDRSLLCSPADLLMTVDLLFPADCFHQQGSTSNQSLPELINNTCPDMRLPP